MPTIHEHKMKYLENRKILDSKFNVRVIEDCNWITTISFYAVLHLIDMELSKDNIHMKSHVKRDEAVFESERLTSKTKVMYKQMRTNSNVARYDADNITPTIANQMLTFLNKVENELIIIKK